MFGKRRGEEGQSMAYMAIIALAVLSIAAFTVDFGMAHVARMRQADMLEQALAKCLEPATTMKVKNSTTPGHDLCDQLVVFLRDEGFDGNVEVYFYEPSAAESGLGRDQRVYVYGATLSSNTETIFGRLFGADLISTAARDWTYGVLYAAEEVYKPPYPDNGRYSVAAGSNVGTWTAATSMSGMGDDTIGTELGAELRAAEAKALNER